MIRSNVLEDSVGEVMRAGLSGEAGNVIVVNPSRRAIEALVDVLDEVTEPPSVRLFAAEAPLKDLMEDFLIASAVADRIESGDLAVRTLETVPNSALLVTDESVVSLVESNGGVAGLTTTDEEFVAATYEEYDDRWTTASEFSLRTPARSRVVETLEADIGADAAADFEAMLDTLDAARGDGDGLDEVTISLLVAARNGELLYDISKWGEDAGVASKATFSRTKTQLEDSGVIDTEKVPIDVGRPRLRLLLADSDLESADVAELVETAQDRLA